MAKPRIGAQYAPKWFTRRASDGAYQALNGPMSADEVLLQEALVSKATSRGRSVLLVSGVALAAVISALYVVT